MGSEDRLIVTQFDELTPADLIQNWVMSVGLVLDSWYGELYTRDFQASLGQRLDRTILLFELGSSRQFVVRSELDTIVHGLLRQVEHDPSLLSTWTDEVNHRTVRIMQLMDRLDAKTLIEVNDLRTLKVATLSHITPHFAVKRIADYLPEEVLTQHLAAFTVMRTNSEDVYPRVERTLQRMSREIATRSRYSEEQLACLTNAEVEAVLTSGNLPDPVVLTERYRGTALLYYRGASELVSGDQFTALRKRLITSSATQSILGMVAYPGIARGVARIVLDPTAPHTFNHGDILVTGMTRPEYLPLMKRAAAFVTDAGGILSHAAITARELKKPCVIGTGSGTTALQDGDLIEVDANQGEIRRIDTAN